MPRLIPRILRNLELARSRPPRPSRRRPLPPAKQEPPKRVFTRPDEVDISPHGRTQSILLDRKAVRQVYRHARYERGKRSQSKLRVPTGKSDMNSPPKMTKEERAFYANPYCA